MPYSQPQDVDKEFFSDFNVTWTFNGATTPLASTVIGPPGVTVTRTAQGIYQVSLPAVYTAFLSANSTPIRSVAFSPMMVSSTAGGTDAPYVFRYIPLHASNSLSNGVFMFATAPLATPTVPDDPASPNKANLLCKFKFDTVVVYPT